MTDPKRRHSTAASIAITGLILLILVIMGIAFVSDLRRCRARQGQLVRGLAVSGWVCIERGR